MNRIEQAIKNYDNMVCGYDTQAIYKVTDSFCLKEGAKLHLFESVNDDGFVIRSSVVEYPNGRIMLLDDWQNSRPTNEKEIEDYNWVTVDGRPAIMFDGLPRILK